MAPTMHITTVKMTDLHARAHAVDLFVKYGMMHQSEVQHFKMVDHELQVQTAHKTEAIRLYK